jgi:hypothetical protein
MSGLREPKPPTTNTRAGEDSPMSMIRCANVTCKTVCDTDEDVEGWRYGDDGEDIFFCVPCRKKHDADLDEGLRMAALAENQSNAA